MLRCNSSKAGALYTLHETMQHSTADFGSEVSDKIEMDIKHEVLPVTKQRNFSQYPLVAVNL